MIKIIYYTPLNIGAKAIRTCWQSFNKSDNGGEKDKELIDRIGNKYKHLSTWEHLRIIFKTDDKQLIQFFKENKFSIVTDNVISTNLRVLKEINIPLNMKEKILPNEYKYLFNKEKQ